MDDFKPQLQSY